ncbi:MAG: hypothetical protein IPK88_12405 [Saprospiraceae bacterium]|nr:hypothetical protein [Candidatus Defluviibacterium haderslevense]
MPISSNTLFHFTNKKENLIGILNNNFNIYYCIESLDLGGNRILDYAAPMVCFCDIPLGKIKKHLVAYGNYGLGLTKEWGIRNQLNPVLYLEANSILSSSIKVIYDNFILKKAGLFWDFNSKIDQAILNQLRYCKNYERKKDNLIENSSVSKYYDEREWRYCPSYSTNYQTILGGAYLPTKTNLKSINSSVKHLKLEFTPDDIKYIFINNDEEILEFINLLKTTKSKKYSKQEVEKLSTRIITIKQLKEDF